MYELPKWVLTNKYPSVFDSESKTAIEQTARLYGAMNDLIEEHNKYVEALNSNIAKFEAGIITSNDCFRNNVTKVMNEYITSIDSKISKLESYLKTNIRETLQNWVDEGSFDKTIMDLFDNLGSRVESLENQQILLQRDPVTEELTINIIRS